MSRTTNGPPEIAIIKTAAQDIEKAAGAWPMERVWGWLLTSDYIKFWALWQTLETSNQLMGVVNLSSIKRKTVACIISDIGQKGIPDETTRG